MKYNYLCFLSFLFVYNLCFSQVGIGTPSPEAALDVTSSNSGVLAPRLALTSTTVAAPVTNPNGGSLVNGTLIWNTTTNAAAGLYPGYYYWNGTRWIRLTDNTRVGTVSATGSLATPNANIPGPLGALTVAGTNSTTSSFDATTETRTINVTGFTGNIGNVTCNVQLNHTWGGDIDIYLQSPTGQIIELTSDNGGSTSTTFNVTFTDSGASNITTWTGGNVSGNYRPEGTLTTDVLTPNITSMAGFNGNSPNGVWTLHIRDDAGGDIFNFVSFSLSIATYGASNYRLVGQASIVFRTGNTIVTTATYSANCADNEGVITALSRTTTSATIGTSSALPSGTTVSFSSDSPRQGSGNFWVSTYNQATNTGLIDGTTYYYQLWVKANVDSPTGSNELFSIIPMLMPTQ